MSFESHTFTATKVASHDRASVRHKPRCDEPMRHNGYMADLRISEAISVQVPMVRHAAEIGWTSIPPEVAKQKRGGRHCGCGA